MKSFTYTGMWWLPSQETHQVAGEVSFSEDRQAKLILHGAFVHEFKLGVITSLPWYPIILGITETGQPITLLYCQETSLTSHLGADDEGEAQECDAEVVFIGSHFTEPQQILFNKVDAHYNYLSQWAGVFPYYGHQKPFDEVRGSTAKGTITVEIIQDTWDELTKKTDLLKEVDLPEVVRIRCERKDALPLDEWMTQFITPLQHLISLATQRPNALVNIVAYIQQDKADQPTEIPVQIAFPPAIIPIPTSKSTVPETILFSLQEIVPDFSSVIDIWLRNADELNSVYMVNSANPRPNQTE